MKTLTEQLSAAIIAEEQKHMHDTGYQDAKILIDEMTELGLIKKPEYSFPLADTIGKMYYSKNSKTIS